MPGVLEWAIQSKHIRFIDASGYMRRAYEVWSWPIHCEGRVSISAADMPGVFEWSIQSKHIRFFDASGYMRRAHEVRSWSIHCKGWVSF